MRGSIIKELLLLTLFFGLLLVPMIKLTGQAPAVTTEAPEPISELVEVPAWITLRFAHQPESLRIRSADLVIWEDDAVDDVQLDQEIAIPIREPVIELHMQVTWPEGTPETVCEVTVEPDGLPERKLSAWGEESLDEIMTFTWTVP